MTLNRIAAAVLATALVGAASANVSTFAFYRRQGIVLPTALGPSTTSGDTSSFRNLFLSYAWDDEDNSAFGGNFVYGLAPMGFESGEGAFSFVAAFERQVPDIGDEFNAITLQADYQFNGANDPIGFQYGLTAGWTDLEDTGSATAFGFTLSKTFMPTEEGMSAPFDIAVTGSQQELNLDGGADVDDWVWDFAAGVNLERGTRIDFNWQADSDVFEDSWFLRAMFPINDMRSQQVRLSIAKDSVFKAEYGFKF